MIEIKPARYFSQFWFVGGSKSGVDFLAALWRDEGSVEWHLQYRFRYYNPESKDPFDNKDRKSWFNMAFKSEEEKAISAGEMIATMTHMKYGGLFDRIPIKSSDPKTVAVMFERAPWAFMREEPPPPSSN